MQGRFRLGYDALMGMSIRQLGKHETAAFERVLAIYREAIEPSEQRPEADLRGVIGREDYLVLVAERDAGIVGFAISWLPDGEDFWLFEYVAATPAERGKGTGAALLRQSASAAGADRTGLVEADAARDDVTARRLGFYERLGCRPLHGLDYQLPLRTHGLPPPMLLLALTPASAVSRDAVGRWLRRLYVGVYGQLADDPRITQMLAALPPDVRLV